LLADLRRSASGIERSRLERILADGVDAPELSPALLLLSVQQPPLDLAKVLEILLGHGGRATAAAAFCLVEHFPDDDSLAEDLLLGLDFFSPPRLRRNAHYAVCKLMGLSGNSRFIPWLERALRHRFHYCRPGYVREALAHLGALPDPEEVPFARSISVSVGGYEILISDDDRFSGSSNCIHCRFFPCRINRYHYGAIEDCKLWNRTDPDDLLGIRDLRSWKAPVPAALEGPFPAEEIRAAREQIAGGQFLDALPRLCAALAAGDAPGKAWLDLACCLRAIGQEALAREAAAEPSTAEKQREILRSAQFLLGCHCDEQGDPAAAAAAFRSALLLASQADDKVACAGRAAGALASAGDSQAAYRLLLLLEGEAREAEDPDSLAVWAAKLVELHHALGGKGEPAVLRAIRGKLRPELLGSPVPDERPRSFPERQLEAAGDYLEALGRAAALETIPTACELAGMVTALYKEVLSRQPGSAARRRIRGTCQRVFEATLLALMTLAEAAGPESESGQLLLSHAWKVILKSRNPELQRAPAPPAEEQARRLRGLEDSLHRALHAKVSGRVVSDSIWLDFLEKVIAYEISTLRSERDRSPEFLALAGRGVAVAFFDLRDLTPSGAMLALIACQDRFQVHLIPEAREKILAPLSRWARVLRGNSPHWQGLRGARRQSNVVLEPPAASQVRSAVGILFPQDLPGLDPGPDAVPWYLFTDGELHSLPLEVLPDVDEGGGSWGRDRLGLPTGRCRPGHRQPVLGRRPDHLPADADALPPSARTAGGRGPAPDARAGRAGTNFPGARSAPGDVELRGGHELREEEPMEYADFVLAIGSGQDGRFPVSVSSPAGEGSGTFEPPFRPEALEPLLAGLARALIVEEEGSPDEARTPADPRRLGDEIFRALFTGQVLDLYNRSLGFVQARQQTGLRVRIQVDPAASELDWFYQVPWEFLGAAGGRFLSLDRLSPVIRYLNVDRAVEPAPVEGSVRILVVSSCPQGLPPLDLARERQQIEETWARQTGIEAKFLERASAVSLRENLLDWPAHVVHFMGHGDFVTRTGEGALLFETPARQPDPVTGAMLATLLQLPKPPALVVLNACDTARWVGMRGFDPFAGVATALVKGGLLAVVAMQFPITDRAALAFSEALYRRLAAGDPVDAAVTEGRLAIYAKEPGTWEWATPVLFSRVPTGRILAILAGVPPRIAEHIQKFDLYIQEKTRGFVGRQFVFNAVQRFLDTNPRGYFFVRGDPGIGKTALLAEMARTRKHVRHFNIRLQNITRAEQFLRNTCAQVIEKYRLGHASLPSDADRSSAFLLDLLAQAASQYKGEKIVILVDALDEADPAGLSSHANLLCLPDSLPQGVYFVATARNLEEDRLPLRIDCENDTLPLEHDSLENLADVELFLRNQLTVEGIRRYLELQRLAPEDFVRELVDKSEGNFMYLRCVLWEMESNPDWTRSIDQLPRGLKPYYEDHWRRMRAADERLWIDAKLPVLMALTATREPIPIAHIARFSRVDDRRVIRSVLHDWKPFLHEEGESFEEQRFQVYHASFFEFLKKKDEVAEEHVSFREAHGRILAAMLDLGEASASG
jgi:hypothetical protein